ncbi:MAG: hypothetical protein P8O89_01975, partial [Polaribacter sp.]|nr:hypothetical protein [Polaribacter sp.]
NYFLKKMTNIAMFHYKNCSQFLVLKIDPNEKNYIIINSHLAVNQTTGLLKLNHFIICTKVMQ